MKKHTGKVLTVLLAAGMAMVITAVTAPLAMMIGNKWGSLGSAAALMLAAIPVHCLAYRKKTKVTHPHLWLLTYLMNSVASGFSVAAFYLHGSCPVKAGAILLGMLPAMAVMTAASLVLIVLPAHKKLVLWMAGLLAAALAIAAWIPAVWPLQPQRSAMFFGALMAIFYLVTWGLTIGREARPVLRDISFGSFGAAILVGLVVLVIITEGDALDYADFGDSDIFRRRKETKNL